MKMSILIKRLKTDIKLILREPLMMVMMFAPMFLIILFKLGAPVLNGILIRELDFDLSPYFKYFTAMTIIFAPYMLSVLTGFLILDEKDQNLFPLMRITPSGMRGYYTCRLFLPSLVSVVYCLFAGIISGLNILPAGCILFFCVIVVIENIMIALFLSAFAKDKVQGMTYAKALGILMLPMFFELFGNKILNYISYITPFYWIIKAIEQPQFLTYLFGLIVHIIWLFFAVMLYRKRERKV